MPIRAIPVLVITVLVITAFSPVYAQKPNVFIDPQGRFTVQVPTGWRAVPLNADCLQIGNGGRPAKWPPAFPVAGERQT